MASKVHWTRMVLDDEHPGHGECRSKCGRFVITRREYQLPFAEVGYTLTWSGGKEEHESLRDAKESAQCLADESPELTADELFALR